MATLDLAVATDRRCLVGAATTVRSALDHYSGPLAPRVWVVHHGLRPKDQDALRRSWNDNGVEINFVPFDIGRVRHYLRSKDVTHMSYARLFLAEVLPDEVGRCIYLDCDMMVQRDLQELWNTDLGGKVAGAVTNGGPEEDAGHFARLGVVGDRYHNAGLLLLDLGLWRRSGVGEAAVRYAGSMGDALIMHDQDILNAVLAGRWHTLDAVWNTWAFKALDAAGRVIHFTMVPKPWHADYRGPFQNLFHGYQDRTAFAGQRGATLPVVSSIIAGIRRKIPYFPTIVRLLRRRLRPSS